MKPGFLLVDKPSDHTSHDVVARIRKKIEIKKIGHCGTLDPSVTGLLVLAVGREATKQSAYITGLEKVYFGQGKLGVETPSQDLDTEPISVKDASHVTMKSLVDSATTFEGTIMQRPPMFSAVKKNGVPLYKLARKGLNVDRERKEREVYFFRIKNLKLPYFDFETKVSKGTYVRTLVNDIGLNLGCGAALSQLRRVSCGPFDISDSHTLDYLLSVEKKQIESLIIGSQIKM
tara:strand:+ start:167 stop:862 length:696 start_codon:yes stop_codon:yes gene_type:complete